MCHLLQRIGSMRLHPLKLCVLSFLVCVFAFTSLAFSQDEEGEYVGWSQGLKYTVEDGDTLWDLSEKFFDTPAMWPELWKQNPHINNPHWIEPGTVINLYVDDGVTFIPKPEPPPLPTPEPVEEVIPEPVEEPPPPPTFHYPSIEKAGFVQPVEELSLGKITDLMGGIVMASVGDTVFVSLPSEQMFAEGDRFTVWRPAGKIKDPFNGKFRKKEVGIQHLILGEVVCTQMVDETMVVVVEQAYRPIKVGDRLMPYRNLPVDIVIKPGAPGMEGRILAEENTKKIFAQGDTVFLNKGIDDGISEGQVYALYTDEEVTLMQKRNGAILKGNKKVTMQYQNPVGKVIILIAKENSATALIVKSEMAIRAGATFQTQELLER